MRSSCLPLRSVITGGPGTGKTTLLDALAERGIATEPEIARGILRVPGGMSMRADQSVAFGEAMLAGEIAAFHRASGINGSVVFDRGLADTAGFFSLERLYFSAQLDRACHELRYEGPIFRAPPWGEIYASDEQRIQSWSQAVTSDRAVIAAWRHYGYDPIDLPLAPVAERAAFVLERIGAAA